jgi:hypothetical protein
MRKALERHIAMCAGRFFKILKMGIYRRSRTIFIAGALAAILLCGAYLYDKLTTMPANDRAKPEGTVGADNYANVESDAVVPDQDAADADAGQEDAAGSVSDGSKKGGDGTDEGTTVEKLSPSVLIEGVPFTSQAPFGNWSDPKEQHGCEEASLIMAAYWIKGKELTPETALKEISVMSDFEQEKYGNYYDTSAADTLQLFKDYYDYTKADARYGVGLEEMKIELAKGNILVAPMDGRRLKNPHYTAPGPERHQLVVIGYDDAAKEFVTNDPGTKFGKAYRYDYDVFMEAMRDYPTGFEIPISGAVKAMIVIAKDQG